MQCKETEVTLEQFLDEHRLLLIAVAKIGYRRHGRGFLLIDDAQIEGFPSEGEWPVYLPMVDVREAFSGEIILVMVEQYDPESQGLVMCLDHFSLLGNA